MDLHAAHSNMLRSAIRPAPKNLLSAFNRPGAQDVEQDCLADKLLISQENVAAKQK
jgi:hypothetical protein